MRTLLIILLGSLTLLFPQKDGISNTQNATLEIRITNIKKMKGHLMVAVFDTESKFLKDFSIAKREKVSDEVHVLAFEDLPKGTYAISIFHDINDNKKLDGNFIGIPKEPYGFSNNPSTFFGPPSFKKASFKIENETKTITVKL
ncbi:DUF2141 domain-containing protein [Winogradskyella sp.]|uniref:DUF2141 domain-containing protein n=1 Tax=Winogradskyella sp. TaxID=1883156 RepID=UPI00261B52C3|nr:DUF2141 domain-containing protein [Winogradskyella sp.]